VIAAGGDHSNAAHTSALERLCDGHWYPAYAFNPPSRLLARAGPGSHPGVFSAHSWMAPSSNGQTRRRDASGASCLGSLQNFLSDATDRERSQKRGGGVLPLPLDFAAGESNYARETPAHRNPGTHLSTKMGANPAGSRNGKASPVSFSAEGKLDLFDRIQGLPDRRRRLEVRRTRRRAEPDRIRSQKARSARMRQRYRDLLRAEINSTVAGLSEVNDELQFLLTAIRT